MKNHTTFVRMRTRDHPEDSKKSKKAPRFVEFNFLTNRHKQKRFCRMKEEGKISPNCLNFLCFAWGLSYDLSKFSSIIFFDFERR